MVGHIKDGAGTDNVFLRDRPIFMDEEFSLYGGVLTRLRETVLRFFNVSGVFFTLPAAFNLVLAENSQGTEGTVSSPWPEGGVLIILNF
jgi:hypothetical protein